MIARVTYENIKEGANAGVMAFHVELNNSGVQDLSLIVENIVRFPTAKQKLLVIGGDSSPEMSIPMYSFIMALKDKGFHIQVNSFSRDFYPWFTSVDRLVMHTTDEGDWLTFFCHEFVLHAVGDEAPAEPTIPEGNPAGTSSWRTALPRRASDSIPRSTAPRMPASGPFHLSRACPRKEVPTDP